jgi:diguanylate cyclase (GGDEF)-like protein
VAVTPSRSERQLLRDALSVARAALVEGDPGAWSAVLRLGARLGDQSRRAEDHELRASLSALREGSPLAALDDVLRVLASSSRAPARVLLVDDDPDVCELVLASLGPDWSVDLAGDLAEAMSRLRGGSYDVVLLDLALPDGDGRQLLLSATRQDGAVYVVCSGREDRLSYSECLALGADAYLRKPVHPSALGMTLRRALARRLHLRAARRDTLTGLETRDALTARFADAAAAASSDRPLCLVLLDMDRFKQINDQHGHIAGDQALQAVAHALSDASRESDGVFRWGGDEFVLVLPAARPADARLLLERVRRRLLERPLQLPAGSLTLDFSAGVAELRSPVGLTQALALADESLYHAKRLRRGDAQAASGRPRASLNLTSSSPRLHPPARNSKGRGLAPTLHRSSP